MTWYTTPTKPLSLSAKQSATDRQNSLTKPQGSLGILENVVIDLAGMQGRTCPVVDKLYIATFAGDHGIASLPVSAYPQAVTRQMLANFATGGACISVMARHYGAMSEVIDCGTLGGDYDVAGVYQCHIAPSTQNFLTDTAMTADQVKEALTIGKSSVDRALVGGADIYVAGEMGIGNTTSSSALAGLLLDETAERLTGLGTGVDKATFEFKMSVIHQAIEKHKILSQNNPLFALQAVGGFEMGAMVGAYLRAGQVGLPVIVGGFISAVCALCAVRINEGVRDYLLFSHKSAEYGNQLVLDALKATPLLDLGLRLGEGTGATTAYGVIKLACDVHRNMATFESAGVSDKHG